jgi:hypothetical protein
MVIDSSPQLNQTREAEQPHHLAARQGQDHQDSNLCIYLMDSAQAAHYLPNSYLKLFPLFLTGNVIFDNFKKLGNAILGNV